MLVGEHIFERLQRKKIVHLGLLSERVKILKIKVSGSFSILHWSGHSWKEAFRSEISTYVGRGTTQRYNYPDNTDYKERLIQLNLLPLDVRQNMKQGSQWSLKSLKVVIFECRSLKSL